MFSGNRLSANKDGSNAFIIVDTKHTPHLNIVGFVYKLNTDAYHNSPAGYINIKGYNPDMNFHIQ